MINLRDPTILSPVDGDVTVTTSYVGYVSTLVPDGTYSSMLATQTKSIPSQSAVWFVVSNWSHLYHVDMIFVDGEIGGGEGTHDDQFTMCSLELPLSTMETSKQNFRDI